MEESTPPTSAANVVDTAQRPQGNARSNRFVQRFQLKPIINNHRLSIMFA